MKIKKYNHDFNSNVLFLGDIHGDPSAIQKIKSDLHERDVIQIGDLGLSNLKDRFLHKLQRVLEEKKLTLHAIRGNHDNPFYWTKEGQEMIKKYDRVKLITDYTEINISGMSCLCVGGGVSIDRQIRTPYKSYWEEELFKYEKVEKKFETLLIHSAPSYFNKQTPKAWGWYKNDPNLKYDLITERRLIDDLCRDIQCHTIIGGHYHNNAREYKWIEGREMRYRCLNIDEVCNMKTLFE